jgi:hypothetical protein
MVEPFGDTAGRPDPAPPGRVAAAEPTRSTKSPVQTPRMRKLTRGHRPRDTGRPHSAIAQRTRGHRIRGHRPDTGLVDATEYADKRPRHGRHRTDILDHHDHPTARWDAETVDLWTAPAALGNDDGSTTVRYLPAREYLQHYLASARSLCRPSRALAHCCPRTISGRNRRAGGIGSSVMASAIRGRQVRNPWTGLWRGSMELWPVPHEDLYAGYWLARLLWLRATCAESIP